jgi:thioredoxin reductase (NADPH)
MLCSAPCGGPAGVAAAVRAGSEGLRAPMIEDTESGGQAGPSRWIGNCMAFPTGIAGADLCRRGAVQARTSRTRVVKPAG